MSEKKEAYEPVRLEVLWQPEDSLEIRYLRALEAITARIKTEGLSQSRIEMTLVYFQTGLSLPTSFRTSDPTP